MAESIHPSEIKYRRSRLKIFLLLCFLLILFGVLFVVSVINPHFQLFSIGLDSTMQSKVVAVFSFLCICLVLWDLKQL